MRPAMASGTGVRAQASPAEVASGVRRSTAGLPSPRQATMTEAPPLSTLVAFHSADGAVPSGAEVGADEPPPEVEEAPVVAALVPDGLSDPPHAARASSAAAPATEAATSGRRRCRAMTRSVGISGRHYCRTPSGGRHPEAGRRRCR